MKRAKSDRGRSARASSAAWTVERYLDSVPEPSRKTFTKLRATIRSAAPKGAEETISYRIPAIKHNGIMLWYAAFSNHCSVFPTPSIIEAFRDELKDFSTSKGTIQFALDKPLPTELVKKLVKARFAQKAREKKKGKARR